MDANQSNMPMGGHNHRHMLMPLLVVILGVAFLGQALGWWSAGAVAVTWPILLIIAGCAKMMKSMCKCGKCEMK